jgi:hypothetical protein
LVSSFKPPTVSGTNAMHTAIRPKLAAVRPQPHRTEAHGPADDGQHADETHQVAATGVEEGVHPEVSAPDPVLGRLAEEQGLGDTPVAVEGHEGGKHQASGQQRQDQMGAEEASRVRVWGQRVFESGWIGCRVVR